MSTPLVHFPLSCWLDQSGSNFDSDFLGFFWLWVKPALSLENIFIIYTVHKIFNIYSVIVGLAERVIA